MKPLSVKQLGFARCVVSGKTQSDAYRENYSCGKMHNSAIASAAVKVAKRENVAAYINKVRKKALMNLEITAERVLGEIAKLAFSNIKRIYDSKGNLIPIHKLQDDVAASISEIQARETGSVIVERKYKIADKRASLDLLGKYLGLWDQRPDEVAVKVEPIIIVRAKKED
jgi:phage terminase small subunit